MTRTEMLYDQDNFMILATKQDLSRAEYQDLVNFGAANTNCGSSFVGDNFFIVIGRDNEIKFFFSYIERENIIEMYDACTADAHRGRGLASKLRAAFMEMKVGYRFWLGVVYEAPLGFHTRLGFIHPKLTKTTALGRKFPFYFVALTYDAHATDEEKKLAREEAKALLNLKSILEIIPRKITAHISPELYERVNSFLNLTYEVGGQFSIGRNGLVKLDTRKKGSETGFSVSVPCAEFNYHTHPAAAYNQYEYALGLPSAADYMVSIKCPIRMSLIFAVEGIYTIELSDFFASLITILYRYHEQTFNALIKNLERVLEPEKHRHLSALKEIQMEGDILMTDATAHILQLYQDPEFRRRVHFVVREFVAWVNQLRWRDLLPANTWVPVDADVVPTNIFTVRYYSRASIYKKTTNFENIPIKLESI